MLGKTPASCFSKFFMLVANYRHSLLFLSISIFTPALANEFHCDDSACDIMLDGPYPNLVAGTVTEIATEAEARQLFVGMRRRGWWQSLPADETGFFLAIQPIAVAVSPGRSLVLLMSRWEADASAFQPGDMIRYSPHQGREQPPPDAAGAAYFAAVGCVTLLCRSVDENCRQHYPIGVYRLADGVPVDERGQPMPEAVPIDPRSMRPTP